MILKILTLYLLAGLSYVYCHELCKDTSAKQNIHMTYCTDYDFATCCSTSQETEIQQLVESLNLDSNPTCKAFMKKILCTQCDPWGAHLFNSEIGIGRETPLFCNGYCADFYTNCSTVDMNWPNNNNLFGGSSKKINAQYPTVTSFCDAQTPDNDHVACYSGVKYVPAPPVPPPIGSPILCVEQLNIASSNEVCCRNTHIIPAVDGSNRLFITKQGGSIVIYDMDSDQVTSTFMTIPNVVSNSNEAGLLNMAFHPNFVTNGKFYAFYSCNKDSCPVPCTNSSVTSSPNCAANGLSCVNGFCTGHQFANVLSEFTVMNGNPNLGDVTSERRLLVIAKPFGNHNGGTLLFGPADSKLYITLGDGGSGNDPGQVAQNPNIMLGKVLRIDVDSKDAGKEYHVPLDNPFPTREVKEVWADGLRNPWRCTFDSERPEYMFCGDVGQDNIEEVDIITKGGNYGWRKYEGNRLNFAGDSEIPQRVDPIITHTHTSLGGNPSVIGGYVYHSLTDIRFTGKYIYGDLDPNYFIATEGENGGWATQQVSLVCSSGSANNCQTGGTLLEIAADNKQDLYLSLSARVLRVVNPAFCGVVVGNVGEILDDAYVRSGANADVNYGSELVLALKNAPGTDFHREVYMKFNTTSVTGDYCTITLRGIVSDQAGDFEVYITRVPDDNWQELSITYNNRPSPEPTQQIGPFKLQAGATVIEVSSLFTADEPSNGYLSLLISPLSTVDTTILVNIGSKESGNGPQFACTARPLSTTGAASSTTSEDFAANSSSTSVPLFSLLFSIMLLALKIVF